MNYHAPVIPFCRITFPFVNDRGMRRRDSIYLGRVRYSRWDDSTDSVRAFWIATVTRRRVRRVSSLKMLRFFLQVVYLTPSILTELFRVDVWWSNIHSNVNDWKKRLARFGPSELTLSTFVTNKGWKDITIFANTLKRPSSIWDRKNLKYPQRFNWLSSLVHTDQKECGLRLLSSQRPRRNNLSFLSVQRQKPDHWENHFIRNEALNSQTWTVDK